MKDNRNKIGISVKCPSCLWSWAYSGKKKLERAYIVCPQCRKATKLIVLKKYNEINEVEELEND
jgi:hypothetical protein